MENPESSEEKTQHSPESKEIQPSLFTTAGSDQKDAETPEKTDPQPENSPQSVAEDKTSAAKASEEAFSETQPSASTAKPSEKALPKAETPSAATTKASEEAFSETQPFASTTKPSEKAPSKEETPSAATTKASEEAFSETQPFASTTKPSEKAPSKEETPSAATSKASEEAFSETQSFASTAKPSEKALPKAETLSASTTKPSEKALPKAETLSASTTKPSEKALPKAETLSASTTKPSEKALPKAETLSASTTKPSEKAPSKEETPSAATTKASEEAFSETQIPASTTKPSEKAPSKAEAPSAATTKALKPDLQPDKNEAVAVEEAEDESLWTSGEGRKFAQSYSEAARNSMSETYSATVQEVQEKEVVTGKITRLTDKYVVIDLGCKSDGLVHRSEFRDAKDPPEVGHPVEVFVDRQEDKEGNLIVSRRKARMIRSWERIQSSHDKDSILEGKVKRRTKGGLIVDIFGIEAFLPGSQVDIKPIRDFDAYVDKTIEVKVVKINYANDNVVVSHKMLIEKDIEQQKAEILNNLEKGQVLEGIVKNITRFGAFIDLGGIDGLLHITDIAWGRVGNPRDILEVEQKVNVVVLGFDDEKKRISLGMKQLKAHPWDITKEYKEGQKIKGKVVNTTDYGAFVEVATGVEGLIHVSELSWSQHLRSPRDFVKTGEEIEAVILSIDNEEHKMALSIRQLQEDPWQRKDLLSKYAVDTRHTGVVRNFTNYGIFLELEEGIDGLVHVSDLSWFKRIKHPSNFVKAGEKLEVVVLELDPENRRVSLSHKHLEKNPWEEFETIFGRGQTHNCTIIKRTEKVAVLELPYGLEGICYTKNLVKEDQSTAKEDETLPFVVTDFSKEDRRIVLSHTQTFKKPKRSTRSRKSSEAVQRTLSEVNKETEKSTLGELESLSSLKAQLEEQSPSEENEAEAEKKATTKPKATAKKSTKAAPKSKEMPSSEDKPDSSS